jgi:hypothetical protein
VPLEPIDGTELVPTELRRSVLPVVLAVVTGVGVAVVGLLGIAWWLLGPDPDGGRLVATSTTGASQEREPSGGYAVWERNADGAPVRWDPCTPIELVVTASGVPVGGLADLEAATVRLREATGLDLRVLGTTDERPTGERPPYQPDRYGERWAPVLVAWADPGTPGLPLRDTDRGVAIPIALGPPGDRTYISAQVILNGARDDLRPGFRDRADSWGATLLHELGHVLGLAHADDPDELMATYPGEGPVAFGPGDLAGLRAVGAAGGCRTVPPARAVEVTGPDG